MNKRILQSRYLQVIIIIAVLMLALVLRLFVLTVIQEEKWSAAATSQNTKEVTTSAPRGDILDRYGRVLAGSKQIFTVTFNVSGMTTDEINSSAYKLVQLLEKNGDKYVNNFPIYITKKGNLKYTYDINKRDWLRSKGWPTDITAEEAFENLRNQYEIDPELDRREAMRVLQEDYSVWPPINIRNYTWTYDSKKKAFLEKYGLDENLTAEEAFIKLKETYHLDLPLEGMEECLSDTEILKIFQIREEIKNTGYKRYRSSTISSDVCDETVAYVEEESMNMKGVEIASESVRVYPNGKVASHILGYMGAISDTQYEEYVNEKGYNSDDLIGKDGIEGSMESYLRGKDGVKTILINSYGNYMETLSDEEPVAGKNVYLTIDMDLQKVAEKALEKAVKATSAGTYFESKYGNIKMTKYEKCQSGAVVALDVATGEVLAMASYPDYDPNIFAEGISTKDWASVQAYNPRDSLSPAPLYNNALRTSVQPGSTFKPVTAVAALQCGLDPDRRIYDKGYIEIGGRTFGCSSWNNYRSTHGYETLQTGIQNSCNFYFYCIASGRDWNNQASLNYDENISVDKIMSVAQEFGLGEKTGIELYEATTPLASAERKMKSMKSSLYYYLLANATAYWDKSVYNDDDALKEDVNVIIDWIEENPSRGEIINRIKEQTRVKPDKVEALTDMVKYSYFNAAEWTIGDEFNIAIGQGDNAYTPLQMARYIAALGNDGERNQVSIIKGIEDTELEKKETYQIDISADELDEVLGGMRLVATRGTLAGCFANFRIPVAGKTGTAERSGYINPPDEVSYVKENLSKITDKIEWKDVEKQMTKLMKSDPKKYPTENDAVDQAVILASGKEIKQSQINQFKDTYDNFAWTVSLAPYDNPKIAVVTLLIQGGVSSNAAPVCREVIGAYLDRGAVSYNLDFGNKMVD